MASNDSKRPLASPSELKAEILTRLKEDGLDVDCCDDERLLFLWRLYKQSEASLQTALENEEKLRIGQTEEMQEVENYVEHIRHLSDEREALIQELETENEQLKNEAKFLKESQNETGREEIAEMLVQQGLEEMSNASTSEQIAYLLVERARLLDELEIEQNQSQSDGRASAELTTIMEQQKLDFEEEIKILRENTKSAQESMSRTHEEEITSLMSENMRMLDETEEMTIRIEQLETEVKSLKEELSKQKESSEGLKPQPARPPSPARTNSDMQLRKVIEEKTRIEGEIVHFRSKFRDSEDDNTKLKQEIQKLEADLDKAQMVQQQLQMKNKKLRSELEETETQLDETEAVVEELTTEKEQLSEDLTEAKNKLAELSTGQQDNNGKPATKETESQEELETLRKDLEEKETELEELSALNDQLRKVEKELKSQCESQQDDIQYISSENEQLVSEITGYKKTVSSLQDENEILSEETESYCKENKTLSEKNKQLQEQLHSIQDNTENSKSLAQDLAKQEIIISHLREQNQKLSSQLNEVKVKFHEESEKSEKLSKQKDEFEKLKESLETLSSENQKLTDSDEQKKKVIEQQILLIKENETQLSVFKQECEIWKQREQELNSLKQSVKNNVGFEKELSDLRTEYSRMKEIEQDSSHMNKELNELKDTVDALQNEIEDLREINTRQKNEFKKHIDEKEDEIFELQEKIDNVGSLSEKYEETATELESTKQKLADSLERETSLKDLRDNLDPRYQKEIEDLKSKLQMTLEELARSQTVISETKGAKLDLEDKLATMEQTLETKERNNPVVQESITKSLNFNTYSQQDEAESEKKRLESILSEEKQRNAELEEKLREYEGMSGELIMTKDKLNRANQEKMNLQNNFFDAEKALQDQRILCENIEISLKAKNDKLQREFEDLSFKLNTAEHQLYETEHYRISVGDKNDEIIGLKDHLQNEITQRGLLEQTVQELKQQVTLLKQQETKLNKNNRELQQKIMNLESGVQQSTERSLAEYKSRQQNISEVGKMSLLDQTSKLQAEMKELQYELLSANDKKDFYYRHYQERKFRTKEKLMRAREYYTREQLKLSEQIQKMEDNLQKTKAMLNKEIVWKEKIAGNCKDLTKEKRDLISRLTEQEENLKDKCWTISMLQVRAKYLEEENSRLQNQSSSQQKFNFNKMIKEGMTERRDSQTKMDGNQYSLTNVSSGIGNSVNSSWDHDHMTDELSFHTSDTPFTGLLNRAKSGAINLLEVGSEQEYDA